VIAVYTSSTPSAGFSSNTTSGDAPLVVSFTSTSTGYPDMWTWDFGDGEISYNENPVHIYNTKGIYNVSLKVMNDNGIYSEDKTDYITVLTSITPTANFTAEASSITGPVIMNFTDLSTNNPTKWYWDFGDDTNSTEQYPVHASNLMGTFNVCPNFINNNGIFLEEFHKTRLRLKNKNRIPIDPAHHFNRDHDRV